MGARGPLGDLNMKKMTTPRYLDVVSCGACYRTTEPFTRPFFSHARRQSARALTRRHLSYAFAMIVSVGMYWNTLKTLTSLSLHSDVFTYASAVPVLSAWLIYLERKRIFREVRYDVGTGTALLLLALALAYWSRRHSGWLSPEGSLSLVILSLVALWMGLFVICYGTKTFRAATFQMLFLVLMVPIPQSLLERAIFLMRVGSAQMAGFLFRLAGVPAFQDGFRFALPGIDLEVAEQCSGIRSGLALLITSLLMGHLFLRSSWRKFWLILAAIPVTIFKNGLRIVTISWLSVHPNLDFLTFYMHRYGGIPFSFLGIALLGFLVTLMIQSEKITWKGNAG